MKLNNIPHVRADAIDAALTNFFAANDLKPIVLGKRRLQNLVGWLEYQNRRIAEINEKRRNNGWANLIEATSPEDQSIYLEWRTKDDDVWIETKKWTNLAQLPDLRLSPLSRAAASQAGWFKIRIYNRSGRCTYFLFSL